MSAPIPLPVVSAVEASSTAHRRCSALAEAANLVREGDALADRARRNEISTYLLDILVEIANEASDEIGALV